jgi:hypothetical protein
MATSANGYPVLFDTRTTGELPRLRKWVIPGTNRHVFLRDGSVGFLLVHFALWWHERIARLDARNTVWDEWGWAVRPIRGKTSGYSNHASASAIDLDATLHPIGVSIYKTFTKVQIARIRLRMAFFRGTLAWGGEWSRPDGMHVEIAKPMFNVEKLARRLSTSPRGKRILAANPGAREVIFS